MLPSPLHPALTLTWLTATVFVRFSYPGSKQTMEIALELTRGLWGQGMRTQLTIHRSEWLVAVLAAGLTASVVLTHQPTFVQEVFDHDEETFLVMAQSVLRGELPYAVAYDNKPPGLFYLLGATMAVFGQSLSVVRWFGITSIALTVAVVFSIAFRYLGVVTAVLISLLLVGAYASQTAMYTSAEIVAVLPVMIALAVLIHAPERYWSSLAAGSAIALAVLVRTNLGAVAVGLGLFHVAAIWAPRSVGLRRWSVFAYVGGGLAMTVPLVAIYAARGALPLLWFAGVEAPLAYAAGQPPLVGVKRAFFALLNLFQLSRISAGLPLAIFIVALSVRSITRLSMPDGVRVGRDTWLAFIVVMTIFLSIALGGAFFPHYMLQLFAPLTALAAIALAGQRPWLVWPVRTLAIVAVALTVGVQAPKVLDVLAHPPQAEFTGVRVAAAIAADRVPSDRVLALSRHIVLFYLNEPPLIPLVTHPSNLSKRRLIAPLIRAGLATSDEPRRLVEMLPRYIVAGAKTHPPEFPSLLETIAGRYRAWKVIDDIAIWRRID